MAGIAHRPMTSSQVSLHWPPARRRKGAFARVRALWRLWRRRRHERTELLQLDERTLSDVDLCDEGVNREATKWFWLK
jgi:uncharacterized protein YjiS (DUF1127 family)